jgi:hypothetical protein
MTTCTKNFVSQIRLPFMQSVSAAAMLMADKRSGKSVLPLTTDILPHFSLVSLRRHLVYLSFGPRTFRRLVIWSTDILSTCHLVHGHFVYLSFGPRTFGQSVIWSADNSSTCHFVYWQFVYLSFGPLTVTLF